MTVNLTKGDRVDLTKSAADSGNAAGLTKVYFGLGWDVQTAAGAEFDLDAVAVVLDAAGNALPDGLAYFRAKRILGDAVIVSEDNLTGAGDGDDEFIVVNVAALSAEAEKVELYVSIYEAAERGGQTFSLVNSAYIRAADASAIAVINRKEDAANAVELGRFDLTEDAANGVNSLHFGTLYRKDGGWTFKAVAAGYTDSLEGIVNRYKVA